MNKLKCIAIDDEPLALEVISNHCKTIPFVELVATFTNPLEALMYIQNNVIDVLFLDIQMPDITGLKLKHIIGNAISVIFVTAYDKHAIESYELDAADYLLKPVAFGRFLQAVTKVMNQDKPVDNMVATPKTTHHKTLFVKCDKRIDQIKIQDIKFIEGLKDYVTIYLDDRKIITRESLKKIAEKLKGDNFVRIHRSYLLSIKRIESIYGNMAIVDGQELPIGQSYKKELLELIGQNIVGNRDQ